MDILLKCHLCNQRVKDPRELLCLHIVCLSCLQKELKKFGTKPSQQLECGLCGVKSRIPDGNADKLPTNAFIKTLFQKIYKNLDSDGSSSSKHTDSSHSKRVKCVYDQKYKRKDKILGSDEGDSSHSQTFDQSKTKNTDMSNIDRTNIDPRLSDAISVLDDRIFSVQNNLTEIKTNKMEYKEYCQKMKHSIQTRAAKMCEVINTYAGTLMSQLKEHSEKTFAAMDSDLKEITLKQVCLMLLG